jgi:DNA-binding NarL/FixJ family response regulator
MIRNIFIPDLSGRERDVLRLIFDGFTSQEIGARLFISERTVESHRKNMISKVGVKNMVGVIRFALERGIIAVHAFPEASTTDAAES